MDAEMTHPRLLASNGAVAHYSLIGQLKADHFTEGDPAQIKSPLTDLRRSPTGGLDRQLLLGADFLVLQRDLASGYSFGICSQDGYVGYVRTADLGPPIEMTHQLIALASHIYPSADMKTQPLAALPFGAKMQVIDREDDFYRLSSGGFIPHQHLAEIPQCEPDYVATFMRFIGVPYLWGGDSIWGMDCSGAVQMALKASGIACGRDTDMQEAGLGEALPKGTDLRRGDFIFWRGHVAVMLDETRIIHANAHHMAVAVETLENAAHRISKSGDGDITSLRRL